MICYPIRIILVEDNPDRILLTERAFKRFHPQTQIVPVKNEKECVELLHRENFSAVILDYNPPGMSGLEVIREIMGNGPGIPVIMVTGQGDEDLAVRAMKMGVSDYVAKTQGYLNKLPVVVERAIERNELQVKLREAEEKYKRLAENARDLILTTDRFGNFTFLTPRAVELIGYSAEELQGKHFVQILPAQSRGKIANLFNGERAGDHPNLIELELKTKAGEIKNFELSFTTLLQGDRVIGFEAVGRDVTQRVLLERQIRQKNKELTGLLSVTSAISHSLNIVEISDTSLERVCELVEMNLGVVSTLMFDNSSLQLSGSHHLTAPLVQAFKEQDLLKEIFESLSRLKRPLTDVEMRSATASDSFSLLVQVCNREQIQSFVVLPLFFKERLLGFLMGGRYIHKEFQPQEIEILSSVCSQISIGISNALLFNAFREAKTEWEITFDAMSELICMQDPEGRIIRVNKALARRLNLEPRDLVNHKAEEVFQDPISPWRQPQRPEMYEKDKIISVEFEDKFLKGAFEIATTPIHSSTGQLFAWLFVGKDVSEQRHLQNQIVQVERLKALGEMASGVAHDFNNVLAGILGKTQVMLSNLEMGDALDIQSFRQNLKTIEKSTIQGAKTVKRIQDFTRIRTDQKFDRVDVNEIVKEAIKIIRPIWRDQCEAKGIKIEMDFSPGAAPPINGIDSELTDVIVNTISNSIDAMPDGGAIRISTGLYQLENMEYAEIKISDNGMGMSDEVKQRIFDPFFSTKGPKGMGLGMSVAYGIIARHHGDIEIESKLGHGTTCMIYLPAAKKNEKKVPRVRTSPMEKHKIRILVIDDEEVIRDFLSEMFASSGYEVGVAATGSEGLAAFKKGNYDLVFSDLGLPEMSGWDVAKAIRASRSDIPIVLLSGWGIQLDDVRIKEAGVNLVLSKPCRMDDLLNAVEEVLKRQKPTNA